MAEITEYEEGMTKSDIDKSRQTDEVDAALGAMKTAIDNRPVIVGIVLDRSGSMESIREATVSGFNEFVQEQKKLPGKVLLSLTLFDTEFEMRHELTPLDQVPELTRDTYVPTGMTALYDGIGVTVASIDKQIANLSEHPSRVVLVIMTDGGENSSKEHTRQQINDLLDGKKKATEPWDVVFLGANQDAFAAGRQMGATMDSTSGFQATSKGVASTYAGVSSYVGRSRSMAAGGQSMNNAFTTEELDEINQTEPKSK